MNAKRYLSVAMAVLLLLSFLSGCGAATESMATDNGMMKEEMASGSISDSELGATADSAQTPAPQNQKLIRKIWLDAETEDMDPLLSAVEKKVAELGGYVEAREVYNGSEYSGYTNRYANLTIRIPADKLNQFVATVEENANVTSSNETADDITLSYVATEAKVKTLETEQTRLLELLAKAENMTEILQIEKRLTEVRGDLEEVTSKLRLYDNMVDYGTVYLDLNEVREYTVVEEEPEGFFARIGKGFMKSLKNIGIFLRELVIFLIVAIPYLLPFAVIAVVIVLLIKWRRKKRSNKKPPFPTKPEDK